MERVMPESIDYQRVLPQSVPAIARRHRYFPQNGNEFNALGSREIRIQIGSPNCLLDASHSYLECELQNTSANAMGLDLGGMSALFASCRVEQGGRVLSECISYNRLHASVLSLAQSTRSGVVSDSLTAGGRSNNNIGGLAVAPIGVGQTADAYTSQRHNANNFLGANAGIRLTMPITSGLFTQDKLIPLPLVHPTEPLTLILRMDNSAQAGCWAGAPGVGSLVVRNICYNAQLIEVGRDVIDQFVRIQDDFGGTLAISGQDWEHSADVMPAATAGEHIVRLPVRKRSLKSLFFTCSSSTYANGPVGLGPEDCYDLSYCGNGNIDTYQLKVGSVVYPPTPINCWGDASTPAAAAHTQRGECAMELAKAFGSLGWTNPTGYLSTISYGTNGISVLSNGDNIDGAGPPGNAVCPGSSDVISLCPFGLDLEAFQREALESGIDTETLSQEANLVFNVNAITAGPAPPLGQSEDKNINMWVLYDQHYYFNRDGSITFSN